MIGFVIDLANRSVRVEEVGGWVTTAAPWPTTTVICGRRGIGSEVGKEICGGERWILMSQTGFMDKKMTEDLFSAKRRKLSGKRSNNGVAVRR